MRPVFAVGNWKMNMTRGAAVEWASRVVDRASSRPGMQLAVCPPFPYLECVGQVIRDTPLELGAQNLYHEPRGAFTGEVSAAMLADLNCRYVLVGHSERRNILGESDSSVKRKLRAALDYGLVPILCVGEQLAARDSGQSCEVVRAQLFSALAGLDEGPVGRVVYAYEPVWAIGTGRNATPEQAEEVQSHIRKLLEKRYNARVARSAVIQYGGSVNAGNAQQLLTQPNVDGLLVGGASLRADEFLAILEVCAQAAGG